MAADRIVSGVPYGPAQRLRIMDVWLDGLDVVQTGDHTKPSGYVSCLMEELEHGVRAVPAGMRQVQAGAAGAEAASFIRSEALQSRHVTILDGYMKTYLNPESLARNPAFSQAVVVEGAAKTIYVGGQNAVRADGTVVGGTLAEQARQALLNVQAALTAAGATLHDVVRWTIAIVDGHPPAEGFAAFREAWGEAADPPAISVHIVSGLADPKFLVEIDAVAVI
jgi:enamine deaminase RidA (YjgF/YER057c/UK114 family)